MLQSLSYVNVGRGATGAQVDWHIHSGYMVDLARERLAEVALERGYSHIFYLDDDIVPPAGIIDRLLSWRYPVCTAVYERRVGGLAQGMFVDATSLTWSSMLFQPEVGQVAMISATGAGCLLVDTRVFRRMSRPWFFYSHEGSEDMFFCRKLRDELLMPILCDAAVRCGHEIPGVLQPGGAVQAYGQLEAQQQGG